MDYSYPEKESVKLDCKTERAICEIKDALKQLTNGLDTLNRKVDMLADKRQVG